VIRGKGAAAGRASSVVRYAELNAPEIKPAAKEVNRPVFVVVLRAERGNGVRGLRRFLKRALRDFGLRCIAARPGP
jgi:hypothetical protein